VKILFVEDDVGISEVAKRIFLNSSHDIIISPSISGSIKALQSDKFDLIILDMTLHDGSGEGVLQYLNTHHLTTPVIINTGYSVKFSNIIEYYKSKGIVKQVYQKPNMSMSNMMTAINSVA
jgi:DNA-binding NtrC family response regulator